MGRGARIGRSAKRRDVKQPAASMANLFCFGLGYTAEHYIKHWGEQADRIGGTVRNHDKAARIARDGIGRKAVDAIAFDGTTAPPEIIARLAETDGLLVSVPPDRHGDPVLRCYAAAI